MTRRMTRIATLLAVLAVSNAASCAVTETGNPPARSSLTIITSEPELWPIDDATGLQHAWVALDDIRFLEDGTCTSPSGLPQVMGPLVTDLVVASELDLSALDGSFCRVEVASIVAAAPLPAGSPADLEGASLILEGHRQDGVPFRLVSRTAVRLDLDGNLLMPFRVGGSESHFILAYDLVDVFETVDLFAASTDVDGTIHIDDVSNTSILRTVEGNLPSALYLYPDRDRDGELDPDELAAPVAKLP